MKSWLFDNLFNINENRPDPHFAFQGTINWMKALSVYCKDSSFEYENIKEFYNKVRPSSSINIDQELYSFENLVLAIHNEQSLIALEDCDDKASIIRSAIISWYYCIFYNSKAMVCARSGKNSETHAKAAKIWQSDLIQHNLIMEPFSLNLTSIVPTEVDKKITELRNGNNNDLNSEPTNKYEAKGALLSYLKGTAKYEHDRSIENIRKSKDFKLLNVENFRKKVARELRDSILSKKTVNFIDQSFRYRGKANYRDAIYLSYNDKSFPSGCIEDFLNDLVTVSKTFTNMSLEYVRKSVRKKNWNDFIDDLDKNNRINFNYTDFINNL